MDVGQGDSLKQPGKLLTQRDGAADAGAGSPGDCIEGRCGPAPEPWKAVSFTAATARAAGHLIAGSVSLARGAVGWGVDTTWDQASQPTNPTGVVIKEQQDAGGAVRGQGTVFAGGG